MILRHPIMRQQGTIKLQLHNSRTGKLEYEQTVKNFVALPAKRRMEWEIRQAYTNGLSALSASVDDPAPKSPFGAIILTDSTLQEDPGNEWMMPGKTIGWANGATYAGIDTLRGTPSITELDAQPTYTKWVYTWPDHAANGTIGSVGFCNLYQPGTIPDVSQPIAPVSGTIEQQWPTTSEWYYFARANSNLSFAHDGGSGTSITRLDGDYAPTLATFDVFPYVKVIRGLAWDRDGEFLWVIGEDGANKVIAKFNSSGELQEGPYNTTNRDHRYLAFDGTNIWSTTQTGSTMSAWCINPENGNDVNNFTHTLFAGTQGQSVCGLCWEPNYQRLWVRTTMRMDVGAGTGRATLLSFNTAGYQQTPEIALAGYRPSSGSFFSLSSRNHSSSSGGFYPRFQDFDVIDPFQFALPVHSTALTSQSPFNLVVRYRPDGMATRARLDTPVTKTSQQTLKVVYQVDYTE